MAMTTSVCALLIVLLAAGSVQAQPLRGIEIFEWGIYEVNGRTAPSASPPDIDQRLDTSNFTHVRTTRMIPARIGTEFCVRFRTTGDLAVRVPLRMVTTFPPAGLIGRVSRMRIESEEQELTVLAGFPGIWCWGFDDPDDIALGEWRIEFWSEDRKFAEHAFTVIRAGAF
jgi:hypothetical protein